MNRQKGIFMDFYLIDHEATLEDIEKFHFSNQKVGVIAHIETEDGKILLQQRGTKSRDDNGLFEDVGGKVEDTDQTFRDAIIREISEEVGDNIQYELGQSIGIGHWQKSGINWIFIIYPVLYIGGALARLEPEKCTGYRFFRKEEALDSNLVTESCKFIIQKINTN